MGVPPSALPFEVLRKLQVVVGVVTCFWEPGSAQGMEEGVREAKSALQTPLAWVPPGRL